MNLGLITGTDQVDVDTIAGKVRRGGEEDIMSATQWSFAKRWRGGRQRASRRAQSRAAKGLVKAFIKVVARPAELVGSNLSFSRRSSVSFVLRMPSSSKRAKRRQQQTAKANLPLDRTVESRRAGFLGTAELQKRISQRVKRHSTNLLSRTCKMRAVL